MTRTLRPRQPRKCRRGHVVDGDNAIVRTSHGREYKSCRACFNRAAKQLMRRSRYKRVLERAARAKQPAASWSIMRRFHRKSRALRRKGA